MLFIHSVTCALVTAGRSPGAALRCCETVAPTRAMTTIVPTPIPTRTRMRFTPGGRERIVAAGTSKADGVRHAQAVTDTSCTLCALRTSRILARGAGARPDRL